MKGFLKNYSYFYVNNNIINKLQIDHDSIKGCNGKGYKTFNKCYKDDQEEIVNFCKTQLKLKHNRDDYKELPEVIHFHLI